MKQKIFTTVTFNTRKKGLAFYANYVRYIRINLFSFSSHCSVIEHVNSAGYKYANTYGQCTLHSHGAIRADIDMGGNVLMNVLF